MVDLRRFNRRVGTDVRFSWPDQNLRQVKNQAHNGRTNYQLQNTIHRLRPFCAGRSTTAPIRSSKCKPRNKKMPTARRATLSGRHTSGPTKPLAQRHGRIESMRTSWQKPANRGLLFNCVGGRLFEPILTQTAHFLVPLQRLKSLNHHPQWRVGNFGENYHAETTEIFTRSTRSAIKHQTRWRVSRR
jgi:hypothetical protein